MAGLISHWPDLGCVPASGVRMDGVMVGLSQEEVTVEGKVLKT